MKKGMIVFAVFSLVLMLFAGCGNQDNQAAQGKEGAAASFKVGMVTDAGTIDDKSFNQGTWEGVVKAAEELKLEHRYLKPNGTTEADYTKEMGNLYDAGYKMIVTPGYKFETAIFKSQDKYEDAKFVLIDGTPHAGDMKSVVKPNTVSILFAEQESGFLAGVAAALQLKEGEAGFIGGMKIPPVQKYNWGFQQGVKYANDNLGTKLNIKPENVIYQGTFDNVAAGSQLAAQMYDRGVKVIFTAAGGVGVGAINEAKNRATSGKEVWVVGVDVDQYQDGVYSGDKSVILTSALKKIDTAAYDMVKAEKDGKFPGGQTLMFDSKNDGIGLPEKNPNLSEDTVKKVSDIVAKIKSGEIKVAAEQGSLIE
ncbi:BMP family lipoprotein [Paenibacillus xerothermodurans]|uniref:BMP family ABC transporter substrate-binding protein n=1 Tax=Paenibacillus xerothermodurans TaxID=1977292 RepID=A0A2W1N5Z6_PAEXE|nr:BMP family ABC transporter substrate-binding protein [Paenibacillus xerothermodurans]PZE19807.1 BMP family ABC transporter substrate-binding protein [Paenibacillus xerothermodurans]